jgi:hypothetical protein
MWEPRRLTTLWAFTACYRNSFTFFTFTIDSTWTSYWERRQITNLKNKNFTAGRKLLTTASHIVHTWIRVVSARFGLFATRILNYLSNRLHMMEDYINNCHLLRLPKYLRYCPFISCYSVTYRQVINIYCCLHLPLEKPRNVMYSYIKC